MLSVVYQEIIYRFDQRLCKVRTQTVKETISIVEEIVFRDLLRDVLSDV